MKTIEQAQNEITSKVQVLEFKKASDGVNLVMEAIGVDGLSIAKIYKSFNKQFKQIFIVRYVTQD